MKKIIAIVYHVLPKKIVNIVGRSKMLKFFRNFVLRDRNGNLKLINRNIERFYQNRKVKFDFYAPIKTAVKAQKSGIENTLLKNSLVLISKYTSKQNLIIFDVGANYGYLSLVWGQLCISEKGMVYSFEPSPTVSLITQKNITSNSLDSKIKLIKSAVGNTNGKIEIFDTGTTSNVINYNNLKPTVVDIITLDQFAVNLKLENVSLIKIDVDGIEHEILEGSKRIINKFKPILIIESNNDKRILEFCKANGYEILDMNLKRVEINCSVLPLNVFCVYGKDYFNFTS